MFSKLLDDINFIGRCKKYNLGLWQCPNFLFIVMALVTVVAMLLTNYIAQRYSDEIIAIFSVSIITMIIMSIGTFVIRGVEKMAEANIIKSEFISIISHQLCTPLSSVRWSLEILEAEGSGQMSEKQKKFLDNVKKSNEKMLKLVSDLLEVVRIDQGRSVFNLENLDLVPLAEEVIDGLAHLAQSKKVEVIKKFEDNLPPARVDSRKMKIIMENLISNAVIYSHEGGKVEVGLRAKNKKIIFSVQDWGVGIPRHQHGKIFNKFFRSNNKSRYRTEGIGMGLYLAKAILEYFDGEIWFESELEKGSTFFVSLPVAKEKNT
jgi:signal transduction histidine kinase